MPFFPHGYGEVGGWEGGVRGKSRWHKFLRRYFRKNWKRDKKGHLKLDEHQAKFSLFVKSASDAYHALIYHDKERLEKEAQKGLLKLKRTPKLKKKRTKKEIQKERERLHKEIFG